MPNPKKKTATKRAPRAPSKQKKRPSIRRQQLQRTGDAILQSALEHFATHGFDGASVRAIAATAGVNHAMIRHIYRSKDELWRQAILFLFERARSELAFDVRGLSDRQAFEERIRRYIQYCARHPEHARLMMQQSILAGPKLTWAVEELIRTRHQLYAPIYERLKEQKALPDVDTYALVFIITVACQMIYVLAPEIQAVTGRDVFHPKEVERHADDILRIFLR